MAAKIKQYENDVYIEIQNYLNSNRPLKLEEGIPYLNSRFARSSVPLNRQGITEIVKSLVQRNVIVEGSKLTREEILLNAKRSQIYNYIVENPGVYYYNIMKKLNMSSHVVIWHLNILVEFNYIGKTTIDNHDLYFEINEDLDKVKVSYYLTNEKCRLIIEYLKSNALGHSKTSISKNLSMHPNTVKKYINVLEDFGIVSKTELSNKSVYLLNKVNLYKYKI